MTCFTDLPTLNLREVKKKNIFSDHRPYLWWLSAHAHQETTEHLDFELPWFMWKVPLFPLQLYTSLPLLPFGIFLSLYGRRKAFKYKPEDVTSVQIAKDSTFCNSCHDVGPHHELAVCQLFDCKYVVFNLKSEKETQATSSTGSVRSAFGVLMSRDVPRDFRLSGLSS